MSGPGQQTRSCRVGAQHHARLQVKNRAKKSAPPAACHPPAATWSGAKPCRYRTDSHLAPSAAKICPGRWSDMP